VANHVLTLAVATARPLGDLDWNPASTNKSKRQRRQVIRLGITVDSRPAAESISAFLGAFNASLSIIS
jgi:hypothetical protein